MGSSQQHVGVTEVGTRRIRSFQLPHSNNSVSPSVSSLVKVISVPPPVRPHNSNVPLPFRNFESLTSPKREQKFEKVWNLGAVHGAVGYCMLLDRLLTVLYYIVLLM